jgi:hypothetical protein
LTQSNIKWLVRAGLLILAIGMGYLFLQDRTQAAAVLSLCEAELRQRLPQASSVLIVPHGLTVSGAYNLLTATVTRTTAASTIEHDEVLCIVHGSQAQQGLRTQTDAYSLYKLVFAPR